MDTFETLWAFRTTRFVVDLSAAPEPDPDLSWDDTGEVQEKLESGEWVNCLFRVRVLCDGLELGSSYLGNSIYADPSEFRDHIGLASRAAGRNYGSYFTDMVNEAVREARKAVCAMPRMRCNA